jgi:hypothetical protein
VVVIMVVIGNSEGGREEREGSRAVEVVEVESEMRGERRVMVSMVKIKSW